MSRVDLFQRQASKRPLIYGHRGARHAAPENTIEAFELAMREGADGIEFDVRVTADRVLAIHHDEKFIDTDGHAHELHRLNFSQLRSLSERALRPIPTLDEVLQFGVRTGALLNVELKPSGILSPFLAQAAAKALRAQQKILVSSFDPKILRLVSGVAPEIPCALLYEKQPPVPISWLRRWARASSLHPKHTLMDTDIPIGLRKGGSKVINVWTVNDPDRARELAAWGVDGIITDAPGLIVSAFS